MKMAISEHTRNKKKRLIDKNLSFQVLGGKKKSRATVAQDPDIYEFTFDPAEEPKPVKKKRKRPTVKKQKDVKPKKAYKTTYDQNISKALTALKTAVKVKNTVNPNKLQQIQATATTNLDSNKGGKGNNVPFKNNTDKSYEGNYPSIRIEDIAADIEPSLDDPVDLNYSPVNTPRPQSSNSNPALETEHSPKRVSNSDPLRLQGDISFFDDLPIANSSMNISVRHPLASPWRVEFGNLPIKWHSNTYVKPNMTPAVESSFICSEESNKKKHVYTNMLNDTNESFQQVISDTPVLKQTSIISFMKEVAEKKAKRKLGRSISPSKAMPIFERNITSEAQSNQVVNSTASAEEVCKQIEVSNALKNSRGKPKRRKQTNDENVCNRPAKSPCKDKNKNCTYFGFDENEDREDTCTLKVKTNSTGRSLRSKSKAQTIVERNALTEKAAKRKRGGPVSPSKAMPIVEKNMTSEAHSNQVEENTASKEISKQIEVPNDSENCREKTQSRKQINNENVYNRLAKSPHKDKNENCTYFGFDESEDRENISSLKVKTNFTGRSLRSKSKALPLVERNAQLTERAEYNQALSTETCKQIQVSNKTENSKETRKNRKRKNEENISNKPAKSPRKHMDKDCTYFGFDDCEDQENVSPFKVRNNSKGRLRRLRSVLKEINGPTRAALPVVNKSKVVTGSETLNKVYEQIKSAEDVPVVLEENIENNLTNSDELSTDDIQSMHLFEDIEVVHHLKPIRKSYGKAKKVTFRQTSDSDLSEGIPCQNDESNFEDDLADLTFDVPEIQEKKKTKQKRPKNLMSKKEEKEAAEWAAGFNSMCEEIDDFPLMVE